MIEPGDPRAPHLHRLLRDVVPGNGFYARKFTGLDLDDFARLPFTTKAELAADQAGHPPYGTNLTYPRERYCRLHQTSGTSSGRPLRWLDTPESWDWLLGCWDAIFARLDLRPGDVFYFAFSFGPFLGFWTAFEAAARAGYLVLPGGGLTSTARLRYLLEHQATVERIEKVWGARVIDHYGMTEVGPVAVEPANRPEAQVVLEDRYIAEVLE